MPWQPRGRDAEPPSPDGFADDVMRAIAEVPQPSPTRTFVGAVRLRSVATAVDALAVAWHLVTVRAWPIAPRVRARSFALVMAVAFVLGTGTLAAAAAVTVVVPPRIDQPRLIDQVPAADPPGPVSLPKTESSSPSPTHVRGQVPAVVHPAEPAAGGKEVVPVAHPTAGTRETDDGQDGSTDSHPNDGSDDGDDDASDGDDRGSDADEPPGSGDDGDHESDRARGSETPEPDDHGTSGHDDDGESDGDTPDGDGDRSGR